MPMVEVATRGCCWVEPDLCSTCDEAIEAIVQHAEVAYKFYPQKLIKAAKARYREEVLAGLKQRHSGQRREWRAKSVRRKRAPGFALDAKPGIC